MPVPPLVFHRSHPRNPYPLILCPGRCFIRPGLAPAPPGRRDKGVPIANPAPADSVGRYVEVVAGGVRVEPCSA